MFTGIIDLKKAYPVLSGESQEVATEIKLILNDDTLITPEQKDYLASCLRYEKEKMTDLENDRLKYLIVSDDENDDIHGYTLLSDRFEVIEYHEKGDMLRAIILLNNETTLEYWMTPTVLPRYKTDPIIGPVIISEDYREYMEKE